jgi:ATP-dependent helicase/nuclease subunit B
MLHFVTSTSAARRLLAAEQFLAGRPVASEVVVVGASRGAADDLVRTAAGSRPSTFGLTRFSLTELAARAAALRLAGSHRMPGTMAGAEAIAARAVFDAVTADELHYFGPVASMPGFPKALARTLHELRLAGVEPGRLAIGHDEAGPSRPVHGRDVDANADIGRLLARVEDHLEHVGVADRAALFRVAAAACRDRQVRWATLPIVLLDVPLDSYAEREFVAGLVECSSGVFATCPDGDQFARDALLELGGMEEKLDDPGVSDLATLRRFVFTLDRPPARERTGDVRLFSAPGEGREAVEIVRRVLDEAERGVPFDQMAVFLRAPQQYVGLLEHACARGDVPAYFDRGTRRPHPAGRAFVALLSCAVDGLSAKRFDEYLSLGQVPRLTDQPRGALPVVRPSDEALAGLTAGVDAAESVNREGDDEAPGAGPSEPDSDDEAVVSGTLRSPWKWEELIVESAVVGGRSRTDGKARWRRRLGGLAAELRYRIVELRREEPESPRIASFERDLRNLVHLRQFTLPIIDELAEWPERANWAEWLDRFAALASRALARPTRVLQILADLRPMAEVGPVSLEEARDVLHDRLVTLDWDPPDRRYGRLFVGTPHQARGRSFRVVFVPGLAERVVPQRPREDPLLLDGRRRALGPELIGQEERGTAERLLLKIAIGAASERLYLSFPRLDVAETRARVPSFYALDVMRAMTGRVPDHRVLAVEAAEEGGVSLAWPAPKDPDRAIDDLEHDLAVLKPLLDAREPSGVKGHAHYLLSLNDALRRSVISRWQRGRPAWSRSDGLIRVAPETQAMLAGQRLSQRPYSLSALQRFAVCPYQFLLSTIYRLEPWNEPEPVVRLDPLTRGSLYHKVQAEFLRAMKSGGDLPITRETLPQAAKTLALVLDRVAAEYAETMAPAIDRVWRDEIDELRRDLGIWVHKLADAAPWAPTYFEFSFGLNDEGRDPESLKEPIVLEQGFILRGSVDLIERHTDLDVLRVTDHKTGKNRSSVDLIVGGGSVLQPVLYSVAVERGLKKKVTAGRLFYSTTAGGFAEREIPINDYTRTQGLMVLTLVDKAIEAGFLPAAPAERACAWCDFRPVCGPREEERLRRKNEDRLADLAALRSMR